MKMKIVIATLAGLAVASLAVVCDPTFALRGLLARESFFGGRPTSYWRRALVDHDPAARAEAQRRLQGGGTTAVPVLSELLRERSASDVEGAEARRRAAELLVKLGPEARAAGPALIGALHDSDAGVRSAAVAALGACGPECSQAAMHLADLLFTEERLNALDALGRMGPHAAFAIPAVKMLLGDDRLEVRRGAARTLNRMGRHALPAVLSLKSALADSDAEVRQYAAQTLGEFGAASWIAVPELVKQLQDENAGARLGAAGALGQIGPKAKQAVPALRALASDPSESVREAATWSLRRIESAPVGR